MTGWIEAIGFAMGGAMLMMSALGMALSVFMPSIDRWNRRYFFTLFSFAFLCVVAFFIDSVIYTDVNMAALEQIVVFFEHVFSALLMLMPTFFLLHCCNESMKTSALMRADLILFGVQLILLIVAQFTDVFYYVTPDNQYVRTPYYVLMLLPMAAMLILNLAGLIRRRKKLSGKHFIAMLIYLLPLTIALFIHAFVYAGLLFFFSISLCAMTMFGLILKDNTERIIRQQRELINQRENITVLQMRPHFICNTMMGIYYLCDSDPQKAKQVTLDFTTYLRKNFTAIASGDAIPFSDELEHTRAYLAVEQAQFEDALFVTYDTPHTMFRVPPLTLQPIVENAVKHGMKASCDPLHIAVITRKTDAGSEIIVEDDGSGYAPTDDNEQHTALKNIRQRLEMMCEGKLTIATREGGGTVVTVTIPMS